MLSKSEKSCCAKTLLGRKLAPLFVLGSLAVSLSASASLTIQGTDQHGDGLNTVQGGKAYYPSTQAAGSPGFFFSDNTVPPAILDLTSTSLNGTSYTTPDQAMIFSVQSNLTGVSVPAGNKLYLMAFNGQYAVPIAYGTGLVANGVSALTQCVSTNGAAVISPCALGDNGYAYGILIYDGDNPVTATVPSPLGTYQVGLYPKDICVGVGAGTPSGCTGSGAGATVNAIPSTSSSTPMTLNFAFVLIADNSNAYNPTPITSATNLSVQGLFVANSFTQPTQGTAAPAAVDQLGLTVYFQNEASTMNCFQTNTAGANTGAVSSSYFPGQGQILLNVNELSLNQSSGTLAPAGGVIVVGNSATSTGGSPTYSGTLSYPAVTSAAQLQGGGGFALPTQVVSGGSNFNGGNTALPIGGFHDSNAAESTFYALQIMLRDVAGWVASSPACELPGGNSTYFVRTSAVNGALSKSSCFIATAAFRSGDEAPVVMLRHFRDSVLLPTHFGTAFVHWYYSWSPPAALWLVDHPAFRLPVLLALVPLQIIAWVCLRPFLLLILASLGAFVLLLGLAYSRGHFGNKRSTV